MKHEQLCAIGNNLADSLASGMCFVIGIWSVDVFGEAAAGDGVIEVDFLNGKLLRGTCSNNLRGAIKRFGEVLPSFCIANGAHVSDFNALSVRFDTTGLDNRASIKVEDATGKCTVTEYAGIPLKRIRALDHLGRIRRMRRSSIASIH